MSNALTPAEVNARKITQRLLLIERTVEAVNNHLITVAPFPAGHWEVMKLVTKDVAEAVAREFRAKGWKVDYNYDTDAYANYFNVHPPV